MDRSRFLLVALALLTAAAGACVPIPHTERVYPALTGVLRTADGTGIPGVTLGTSCVNPTTRTTTDSLGRFAFPEAKQHYAWLLLMGDAVSAYDICALEGDSGTVIYQWMSLSPPPRTQALLCTAILRPVPMTACREPR